MAELSPDVSADPSVNTPKPTVTPGLDAATTPSKRKRNMLIFTLLVLAVGAVVAFLYLTQWRYAVSTEDAYVSGNQVQITAQISGTVQAIGVNDTDVVKAGQVLIGLDKSDNGLALETAKSQLTTALRQFKTQSANVEQANTGVTQAQTALSEVASQIKAAQIALAAAKADYQRRAALTGMNAVSKEEIQHAADTVAKAQAQLDAAIAHQVTAKSAVASAQAQRNTTVATIGDDNVLHQPAVQAAITNIENAWLNLDRTQIIAPVDGQIARRTVQLGQKISAGTPLMVVVPLHDLWVDANFKENQLKDIRIGQAVTLTSDLYGDKVVFHGKVIGLSAGTGSAFSALPAQNATGNWIKVTQRVPVRIKLDDKEVKAHPLRVGLSMQATIDSRDAANQPQVASAVSHNPPVAMMTAQPDMAGAKQIVQQILQQNL